MVTSAVKPLPIGCSHHCKQDAHCHMGEKEGAGKRGGGGEREREREEEVGEMEKWREHWVWQMQL